MNHDIFYVMVRSQGIQLLPLDESSIERGENVEGSL